MNNPSLFSLLSEIVSRKDWFDEGVLEVILKKIGPNLKQSQENILRSENFDFSGNIWAKICRHVNPEYSLEQILNDEQIKKWLFLLNQYCPELLTVPQYKAEFNYKNKFKNIRHEFNISLNFYELIKNGPNSKLLFNNFTQDEKYLFLLDSLNERQDYTIYHSEEKTPVHELFFNQLIDILLQNKDKLFDDMKWNNSQLVFHLLNSNVWKKLFSHMPLDRLNTIIDDDALMKMYKDSLLKNNLIEVPDMFNNVLPLASPQKWLEILKRDKKELKLENFEKKFLFATGYSLKDRSARNPKATAHKKAKQEFLKEFAYLLPAIDSQQFSDDEKINWYNKIITSNFKELFILSAHKIEIPQNVSPENEASLNFLKILLKNTCDDKDDKNYMDCYNEVKNKLFAEKLNDDLENKSLTRKIKL